MIAGTGLEKCINHYTCINLIFKSGINLFTIPGIQFLFFDFSLSMGRVRTVLEVSVGLLN